MMFEKREQGIIRLERNNIALDGDDNEKVEKSKKRQRRRRMATFSE